MRRRALLTPHLWRTACRLRPNRLTGFLVTAAPIDSVAPSRPRPRRYQRRWLDGSASMAEADASGTPINNAKAAAPGLIAAVPDDATLASQTHGTTTGTAPEHKPAGCCDLTVLQTLRTLDRASPETAIDSIARLGYTPVSLAL